MPNKNANQIHTVLISAHFSSISEIYCSQISVVSWIRVLFLSAVCSSFGRVSTFSWASPRNCTCKMLMRWSAHLPKRGVTECVTDTNWFYWLVITLITFFLLVTIFVTMFINVYLPIYYSWNPTLLRPFCVPRAYKRRPWRPFFSLFSNSKDLDLCSPCNFVTFGARGTAM